MIELLSGELTYLWEMTIVDGANGITQERAWFLTEEDAKEAGELSKPGFIRYVQAYQVLKQKVRDNVFNYYKIERVRVYSDEEVKKQALAKLTSIEKRALGL